MSEQPDFIILTDDKYSRAIGRLISVYSFLDYLLGELISDLLNIDPRDGRAITSTIRSVRDKVDIITHLFGKEDISDKVHDEWRSIAVKIGDASEKRNDVVHGIWATNESGQIVAVRYSGKHRADGKQVPYTEVDLLTVTADISEILNALVKWVNKLRQFHTMPNTFARAFRQRI